MYRHTQIGWVVLGVCAAVIIMAITGLLFQGAPVRPGEVLLLTAIPLVVILLFYDLKVTVDEEAVEVSFGPGLIRKRVALADVAGCEPFRYPWWWGWGIRMMGARGGWLFNVSGREAVEVRLKDGSRFGIGTDEPEAMCDAIRARLRASQP